MIITIISYPSIKIKLLIYLNIFNLTAQLNIFIFVEFYLVSNFF
jgi:hypothetical protein